MRWMTPLPPVPLRTLFLRMGGWIVLITGVILVMFSLAGHFNHEAANRFDAEGRPATGIVQEKFTTQSRNSEGDTVTTRWLVIDFTTRRGEEISIRQTASVGEYARAEVDAPFDLVYLESRPETVELTPGSNRSAARTMQWISLLAGLAWLWSLWLVGGWAVAAVRARRYGQREEARVIEVRSTGIRVNRQPRYRLVWQDDQGRSGESLLHRFADLDGYKPGDRIEIYQGIKRSWWAGDVGHRSG